MMSPAGKILTSLLVLGIAICFLAESVSAQKPSGKFAKFGNRKFHKRGNYTRSGKFREIFGEERDDVPEFCHKKACPKFTLADENEDYEVRQYEASSWLAINKTSDSRSNRRMFRSMFSYLRGNNSENRTVQMGIPVLKKIMPGEMKQNTVMLFYMSQTNLPKPNDSRLYFVNLPAQTFYVRVFGGYAFKKQKEENRQKVIEAVGEDNVDTGAYFSAGYDAPWVKKDRHNEVWLSAKN